MIKFFVLIFILSTEAHALSLSQERSSPEGHSQEKFILEKDKTILTKTSNFFDKNKNYRIGKFTSTSAVKLQAKAEAILKKIKTTDAFLKTKGSDFNSLSDIKSHNSFIRLDGFNVAQNSSLFNGLKNIIDQLQKLKWQQQSGIALADDFKKVDMIKDGKIQSSQNFNFAFSCRSEEKPTVCAFKDLGFLYIQ